MASNVEDILKATIDGKIYGGNVESRVEELLVELKDKIDEGGGGGTGNYNELVNKPVINNVELEGLMSLNDLGIPTSLSALSDDYTHRTVTDAEKTSWNGKSNFSGSYDDLTNKPTINNVSITGNKTTEDLIPIDSETLGFDVSGKLTVISGGGGGSDLNMHGSGRANSLAYIEDISEITSDMYDSIDNGSFDSVHVGMHYTAPSGRDYYMADANYFLGHGETEIVKNHMLMIEGNIHNKTTHSNSSTISGAIDSRIYKYSAGLNESEIITDFGSDHIIQATFLLSNQMTDSLPSGYEWVTKKIFIPNMPMVCGHYLQYKGNTNEMYNGGNRIRQISLFQRIPELIVARDSLNHNRISWWCDDIALSLYCAAITEKGNAENKRVDEIIGIRRVFLIGKGD